MSDIQIDERRLVDLALHLVSTPSFMGSEQAAAELMRDVLDDLRLHWQQVEDGRANALASWTGAGGGCR
jgi:hypothetical protein